MIFDFPIDKVEYEFDCKGDCLLDITINGRPVTGNVVYGHLLKSHNILKINFSKTDPTDTESFAVLKKFKVNDGDFLNAVKTLEYKIDNSKHKDAEEIIENNLYFGYVGSMEIILKQTTDLLKKAAWTIADKEFESVKWPLRGDIFRIKNFDNIYRDARYMFTGCQPPLTKELVDEIDNMSIKDLKIPLNMPNDRNTIEKWLSKSERITINGLEEFDSFVPANGVTDCLRNFVARGNVFMPPKMYFFNGEMLTGKEQTIQDVFTNDLTAKANLIFEYPSPWYSKQVLDEKISEAKKLGCHIALDLTWLPIANDKIDIDLNQISEVFVSMNKAWPTQDIRPAFRWSREKSRDDLDLQMEYCSYTKINVQVFMKLLKKFDIDYIYNYYRQDADSICKQFDLEKTSVLWFTKHKNYKHDPECYISDYYYLDDFVCIRELLAHKGKHFW